jgi:hypothetical protein
MSAELVFQVLFAAGIVAAGGALLAGALAWVGRTPLLIVTSALGAAAAAAWTLFALRPSTALALSAGGLTACLLASTGALPLAKAIRRSRRLDAELERVEGQLRTVIEQLTGEAEADLERVLARARADSISRLADEERRIAEERRREVVEREEVAQAALSKALVETQRRIEAKLASWSEDLDRAQQNLTAQLDRIDERQRELIADAEKRVAADVERLVETSDEQRTAHARLRQDLASAAEQLVAESTAELEHHTLERRRALQEVAERLRRRERELHQKIEREETEAAQRIQSGFADVERRALEQLERSIERATTRYAEAAEVQFDETIRGAREDAARRLSRELDRAVESFSREAATVLAERLAQIGDAGAQRLEKRLSAVAAGIERQREELFAGVEERILQAEADLRRRLQTIVADAEGERGVLEARLEELVRRVEEAASAARNRPAPERQRIR